MILHRPAHDPAAIDVQDGGQIEMDAPPGASRFGLARISLLTQNRGGFSGGRQATMAKELRTAQELSDMIVSALGVKGVEISIRRDHAFGWQPTVNSCPGDKIFFQRRVEEIANQLRFQFDLRG